MSFRLTRTAAQDKYEELRVSAVDVSQWPSTSVGADLWIDGLDAIRSTPPANFAWYLDALIEAHRAAGPQVDEPASRQAPDDWELHWDVFDGFVQQCARDSEAAFYHSFCVGLVCLLTGGGVPDVRSEANGSVIVNDSLMYLLSPTYRAVRVAGYNQGARCVISSRGDDVFRPAASYFSVPDYAVVNMEPVRAQHYNINHDLAHLSQFSHVYLSGLEDLRATAEALVVIEETCCAVDLWTYGEVARFGVALHTLDEMRKIQAGWGPDRTDCVFPHATKDVASRTQYRRALVKAGLDALGWESPEAAAHPWGEAPADLHDWISASAVAGHVSWCVEEAGRLTHPEFRRISSLIPPDSSLEARLSAVTDPRKADVVSILFAPDTAPDDELRSAALVRNELAGLAYDAATASVELNGRPHVNEVRSAWASYLLRAQDPAQGLSAKAARSKMLSFADQTLGSTSWEPVRALLKV